MLGPIDAGAERFRLPAGPRSEKSLRWETVRGECREHEPSRRRSRRSCAGLSDERPVVAERSPGASGALERTRRRAKKRQRAETKNSLSERVARQRARPRPFSSLASSRKGIEPRARISASSELARPGGPAHGGAVLSRRTSFKANPEMRRADSSGVGAGSKRTRGSTSSAARTAVAAPATLAQELMHGPFAPIDRSSIKVAPDCATSQSSAVANVWLAPFRRIGGVQKQCRCLNDVSAVTGSRDGAWSSLEGEETRRAGSSPGAPGSDRYTRRIRAVSGASSHRRLGQNRLMRRALLERVAGEILELSRWPLSSSGFAPRLTVSAPRSGAHGFEAIG